MSDDSDKNVLKHIAKTNPQLLVKNLEYYEQNAEQVAMEIFLSENLVKVSRWVDF